MSFPAIKTIGYSQVVMVLINIFFFASICPPLYAATYYVDATNGRDTNTGISEKVAWKTIAKVNISKFLPGDQILFKRGEIWREQLIVHSSGSSGNPITFGAYGSGDKPLITGSETLGSWQRYLSTNMYFTNVSVWPANVFQDETGDPLTETKSIQEVIAKQGSWYYSSGEHKVYVQTKTGINPSSLSMEMVVRDYCIYGVSADYIVIDGLRLHRSAKAGISALHSSMWTVKNCQLSDFAQNGILAQADKDSDIPSMGWLVENNQIGRINCDPRVSDSRGGITMRGMRDTMIRHNKIYTANSIGILLNSAGPDGTGSKSSFIDIYRNEIVNSQSGIALFNSDDCKIYQNHIHDGMGAGILVQWRSNRASVYTNLINNLQQSFYGEVYNGIDVNAGSMDGKIYNNTVRKVHGVSCTIEDHFEPSNGWVIKNNIFDARENNNGFPIQVYPNITTITISNNNYVPNPQVYGDKVGRWKNIMRTLPEWREVSGDLAAISTDPRFLDTNKGNLRLDSTSPCIGSGTDVGLKEDFWGNQSWQNTSIDMGAIAANFIRLRPPLSQPGRLRVACGATAQ